MTSLHILAALIDAAPVGTPINWRRVLWPNHDTAAIRTLFDRGYLDLGGIVVVVVTKEGADAVRRELCRQRAAARGLLLSLEGDTAPIGGGSIGGPAPAPTPPPSDSPTSVPIGGS